MYRAAAARKICEAVNWYAKAFLKIWWPIKKYEEPPGRLRDLADQAEAHRLLTACPGVLPACAMASVQMWGYMTSLTVLPILPISTLCYNAQCPLPWTNGEPCLAMSQYAA